MSEGSFEPRHILAIRASRLGDLLFTTPALAALRQRFPAARISVLTNPYAAPLIEGSPDVDVIYRFDPKSAFDRVIRSRLLARRLRGRVDLILAFRDKPIWRTFAGRLPGARWHEAEVSEGGSLAARYLASIRSLLGDGTFDCGLRFIPTAVQLAGAEAAERRLGLRVGEGCVLLQPCYFGTRKGRLEGRRNSRAWPLESFRELGRRLVVQGRRVLVLGAGPGERSAGEWLVEGIGPGAQLLHDMPIGALGALMRAEGACGALVSIDTGPLHLAVAAGLPAVVLYGPTRPELTAPAPGAQVIGLRRGLPCSPCKGRGSDCYDNICLKGLEPEDVLRALDRLPGISGPELLSLG